MAWWRGGPASLTVVACLVLVCYFPGLAECTAQRQFLQNKLKDYDVNVWPDFGSDSRRAKRSLPEGIQLSLEPIEATKVKVQMFINSFGSLNAANMDYSIDVFLRQNWNDPRLKFNGTRTRFTITDPAVSTLPPPPPPSPYNSPPPRLVHTPPPPPQGPYNTSPPPAPRPQLFWALDGGRTSVVHTSDGGRTSVVHTSDTGSRKYDDVTFDVTIKDQVKSQSIIGKGCTVVLKELRVRRGSQREPRGKTGGGAAVELRPGCLLTRSSSVRVTLTLSCSMEFEHYPFDAQVCGTSISSYANTEDVIQYEWVQNKPIDLPDELEVAQFDLISYSTESLTQTFVTGNFTGLKVHFNLRRQNGYHVLQTYIPTILIVTISWVSFWLDPNAVPGRVSLGVTTLLTLTTLASGIRAQLPPVSYVKAIDVWIGMCMIMVFGALLEFTFVNWLANKKVINQRLAMLKIPKALAGSDAEEVGNADKKMEAEKEKQAAPDDAEVAGVKTPKTYINFARALDRLCRAFFPGVFLVFNLIYWPYYLIQQRMALEQ
ncbi:glycine receptor subunit alpha-2-like [Panulirus ornatus]|uniref:glycine receptor subunit alpha-2-like n=1 Tax=Panulirus ornatus TaxID=150431 RepID=UPI003A877024